MENKRPERDPAKVAGSTDNGNVDHSKLGIYSGPTDYKVRRVKKTLRSVSRHD